MFFFLIHLFETVNKVASFWPLNPHPPPSIDNDTFSCCIIFFQQWLIHRHYMPPLIRYEPTLRYFCFFSFLQVLLLLFTLFFFLYQDTQITRAFFLNVSVYSRAVTIKLFFTFTGNLLVSSFLKFLVLLYRFFFFFFVRSDS